MTGLIRLLNKIRELKFALHSKNHKQKGLRIIGALSK